MLIVAAMREPHFLAADISSLRRKVVPTVYVFGDASTSTGGGGWMGPSTDESSFTREAMIRWSPAELLAFEKFGEEREGKPVDINVMEYFVIVYLVMLWGRELRGKCVGIRCDNTAAVSWLQKHRASNKSPIGETLVHVFSLFCITNQITLVPLHIQGVLNVKADFNSRCIDVDVLKVQELGTSEQVDLKDEEWWKGLSREAICRSLLLASTTMPLTVPSKLLLKLLKALQ